MNAIKTKPLVSKSVQVTATHTNVAGYFNSNSFPVQLQINSTGRNWYIEAGRYVTDEAGAKINDPVFENYTGPCQLSREWSNGMIKIYKAVPPVPVNPLPTGFAGTQVSRDPAEFVGNNRPRPISAPINAARPPSASTNPVKGFTADEARRLGHIRPTVEPNSTAAHDGNGAPVRGESLETIEFARDMTPGEAKRTAAPPRARPVVTPPPEINEEEEHAINEIIKVDENFDPDASDILSTISKEVVKSVTAVPVAAPQVPPASAFPPPPVQVSLDNLPQPNLDEELPAPPVVPATPAAPKRFVCVADSKGFNHRSELLRYAERKYPDRVTEIMSPYPKA